MIVHKRLPLRTLEGGIFKVKQLKNEMQKLHGAFQRRHPDTIASVVRLGVTGSKGRGADIYNKELIQAFDADA